MGFRTQLEYKTSSRDKADIYAYNWKSNYLYEVKPITVKYDNAKDQLDKYLNATKFSAGPWFEKETIDFLPRITMEVFYEGSGIIKYRFFKEKVLWWNRQVKEAIEENRVAKAIRIGFWVGVALAGAIVTATLIEDVVTGGAGIANDVTSFRVASSVFRGALTFGMMFV